MKQQTYTNIDNSNSNIKVILFSSMHTKNHEDQINKWLTATKCIILNISTYNKENNNITQIFYENI